MKYLKIFEDFRMDGEVYEPKLQITDMVDQLQALTESDLNSGRAMETLMTLLGQLDPSDARRFVKSHLSESPNDGFRPSGRMVFRFPRPMGRDVEIPVDVQSFIQYL